MSLTNWANPTNWAELSHKLGKSGQHVAQFAVFVQFVGLTPFVSQAYLQNKIEKFIKANIFTRMYLAIAIFCVLPTSVCDERNK